MAALAAGAFFAGSVGFLAAVTGATLLVQAVDGCVGLWGKSLPRAAGPFLMALLHGAGPGCDWPALAEETARVVSTLRDRKSVV